MSWVSCNLITFWGLVGEVQAKLRLILRVFDRCLDNLIYGCQTRAPTVVEQKQKLAIQKKDQSESRT